MRRMKIWHQSFTDLETFPRYAQTLRSHAQSVVPPEVTVEIHGLAPQTYPASVAPMNYNAYPYLRYHNGLQVCQAAMAAEAQSYDAMALGCFFDPALREARSLVNIPVVSLSETSVFTACSMGRRFAMISLSEFQAQHTEDLVRDYGLTSRLAGIFDMSPSISLFELERDAGSIRERFEAACRKAIAQGAEVIIPGDGVLNAFLVRSGIVQMEQCVVMDPLGVLFHHAIYLASLKKYTGLTVSRRQFYSMPPAPYYAHCHDFNGVRTMQEGDFSRGQAPAADHL